MSAKTNDTLFLAIGGLALLGAGVWAFVQQSDIDTLKNAPSAPASGTAYEPTAIALASPASQTWADAPDQTAGPEWIYDVFTPPKIYYNTATKTFVVEPPTPVVDDERKQPELPTAFGLELIRVEQPLFRLQLVGYVGEGEQARGNFLNVKTGAVIFGTTGKKLPDLDLEIVRFSATRRVVPQAGGTTLVFVEVSAVVRDTKTGVEIPLDSKTRVPEGSLQATFKVLDGTERTVRAGESFTVGQYTYKIEDLTLAPPSAKATKEGGQRTAPETQTLTIAPPPASASDSNAPSTEGIAPTPGAVVPSGAFPGF
jgi:hypothetical protein